MKVKDIIEVAPAGNWPDEHMDTDFFTNKSFTGATKIEDLAKNLSLWKKGSWLTLAKDETTLLGGVSISPVTILGTAYDHIDAIYIFPQYRKSSAAHWLLYAVKEHATNPVIADGAIFSDGGALIDSILRHKLHKVHVLNKKTGQVSPYTEPVYDNNSCYLFEQVQMGYGKIYEDFNRFIWYNWFEEIA